MLRRSPHRRFAPLVRAVPLCQRDRRAERHRGRDLAMVGRARRRACAGSRRRCRGARDCFSEGFVGEARRIIRDGLPGVRWLRDRSTTRYARPDVNGWTPSPGRSTRPRSPIAEEHIGGALRCHNMPANSPYRQAPEWAHLPVPGGTDADARWAVQRVPRRADVNLPGRGPGLPRLPRGPLAPAPARSDSKTPAAGPRSRCSRRGSARKQLRTSARQSLA